jgi:hypothetical protein
MSCMMHLLAAEKSSIVWELPEKNVLAICERLEQQLILSRWNSSKVLAMKLSLVL